MLGLVPTLGAPAVAVSTSVVISEVYGGGGNTGATFTNDFIELYNLSASPVDLTGWSVQYASSAGTTWSITPLTGIIPAGGNYLIQQAAGAGGTAPLPTPNATGSTAMSATAGKVALVNSTTGLSGAGCPFAASVVDFVGYGSAANCFETAATGNTANTTSAARSNPAVDTDNNSADFAVGAPTPQNAGDTAPAVSATSPVNGSTDISIASDITITFNESVNVTGAWFGISCTVTGAHTATVTGGPTTFTLNPDVDFANSESCSVSIVGANVTDTDPNDPPDSAADSNFGFTTTSGIDPCTLAYTPAYSIQGDGAAPAITGAVTTQGVVIGDYEGPSPTLRGFYLQDLSGDGNAATSDAVFVFNGDNNSVALGDVVRVQGTAGDFQDQTQVSASTVVNCGTASVDPVDVSLPVASTTDLERFEGMLVRFPQTLFVTEMFQLGRFGLVVMSSGARLAQPTNVVAPGAPANALQLANNLNRIIVDDALQNQNPDPLLFGRGGNPLSAANTLRGGDTATGMVGVMSYTWAGNAASPNNYRLRPINSLGGGVPNFQAANPRPAAVPAVGGTISAATLNLLNYFNTFTGCTFGLGGPPADCRGASSQFEFDRQWPKTVEAVLGSEADVIGINEIENDGYGPNSAIVDLVGKLNAATAPGTFAFVDFDAATGQTNALGTDAIKVGLIYRVGSVSKVGTSAVLNTLAFVNGGDSGPRNRATYVQAFADTNGGTFVVTGNHLKSKGSACDAPDAGDGQGNCAIVRNNAVNELITFLNSDPTGTGERDILILGDLNSYAMETPITTLLQAGYSNLVRDFLGDDAYSFAFDGQWGYLDHAMGYSILNDQVTGVGEWHINADEPSVLDYNVDFKSVNQISLFYAADEIRSADHDPLVVGLDLVPTYDFGGFQTPFTAAVNFENAGRSLPVKFSLGGNFGLSVVERAVWLIANCTTGAVTGTEVAPGTTTYSAATGSYTFETKSAKAWKNQCRTLELTLNDGTVHSLAFRFR